MRADDDLLEQGRGSLPLAGIKVLDFSTLLPGPLATLILAEAGAEVIKVERPGGGDDMRRYKPFVQGGNPNFAMLNRGKRSITVDLKNPAGRDAICALVRDVHVVVEQFRPGVMRRLRLGYEDLRTHNPSLIYCAITGYGQTGPKASVAAHDLNYVAEAGMLALAADKSGSPIVPAAQVADIGGGTLPAIINILLALRHVERTGEGAFLDISMTDNVFCWQSWALGQGEVAGLWPRPGGEAVSGGSARYQIYRTADGKYLAAAPLEDHFWANFCQTICLPEQWRDDEADPAGTVREVGAIIAARSGSEWQALFMGKDTCCSIVTSLEEARTDAHVVARGLFSRKVITAQGAIPALPLPLAPQFQRPETELGYPETSQSL